MLDRRNPEAKGIWAGIGLLTLGALLIFGPTLGGVDGMDGGFALAAFGLLLAVSGLVTLILFIPRAVKMKNMLAEQSLLAHWIYDARQMETEADNIRRQWSERNRALFTIVLAWTLVITAAFVIIMLLSNQSDALPMFLGIMIGVTVVVAAVAFGMPHVMARQARHGQHEALIGTRSLYFGGTLYTWGSPLEKLDSVNLIHGEKERRLVFRLRSRSGPYLQFMTYVVEVPIPSGREAEAEELVDELRRQIPAASRAGVATDSGLE